MFIKKIGTIEGYARLGKLLYLFYKLLNLVYWFFKL